VADCLRQGVIKIPLRDGSGNGYICEECVINQFTELTELTLTKREEEMKMQKAEYKRLDGAVRAARNDSPINPPLCVDLSVSRILTKCERIRGVSAAKSIIDGRIWIDGPCVPYDPPVTLRTRTLFDF
jgi:hypothetical protein